MRSGIALLILLVVTAPGLAAETAGLPPVMWERIRAAEPESVDLSPTPSPQAPPALSLTECLDLAFRHNARFRRDQANLVNSRQGLWVADQRLFYAATARAERERPVGGESEDRESASAVARWEGLAGDALELEVGTGSQSSFGDVLTQRPAISATYDRPILRGAGLASSTWERVRSARVGLASEELLFYESRQSLALSIIQAYFRALLAQGEIEIAERAVDRAKRFYDLNYVKFTGEELKKPGEEWVTQVAEIDVDQARLSWERSKQSLISRQQGFQDAVDALLLEMGFVAGATPDLMTAIAYEPQDYDEAGLSQTALTNSTELARLNLSREDAAAARRIVYSEYKPDLIASAGFTDAGQTIGGQSLSAGWFAGLRVQVPLRERARFENRDRADRNLDVLDQQIVATREQVTQEMQALVRAAEATRARIAIGEDAVALARKNREQAQGMYDEGLSDYLRVLDADRGLVEAERSLLQEKVDYFLTTIRIRRALGEDITAGLPA